MGTISLSLPADGTTADVADVNTPFNTIANEFNGNIDNNNIKTGAAIATAKLANDAGITTAKLANASVTADKLATGAATASVATSEGTASGYPVDLATSGPTVTVTIGANGLALVFVKANMTNSAAGGQAATMGYAVSGATTVAASAANSIASYPDTAGRYDRRSGVFLHTGLTPGSNTFTAKYGQEGGGTATYDTRQISVIPL